MIETSDLGKRFNDFVAVQGLTISVQPGQIFALLGQNGAGKTTTVRMLTALLQPTQGWARVNGYDVLKQGAQVRASVGVLTEQHGIYIRMTAQEYLDFFGELYKLNPATRVATRNRLLEYFGLTEAAKRRVGEYSKGMKQKLALARALMHDPPVLLLDEPTSAMDPESARLVRDQIASLKSSRRTTIICTHNLAEAEAIADVVAIIYRGKILVSGSVEQLKKATLGPSEYEILFAEAWGDTLELPTGVELLDRQAQRLLLKVKTSHESNPVILQNMIRRGARVVSMQESPRSLEQVYLKVMADAHAVHALEMQA